MINVSIISGFLGAGKTTLIKKLIADAFEGEKVILLENEYGEVGIDGGFMKDAGIEVSELNSGCICCTLVGDFHEAIDKLIAEYHPDRLIIEPSGVGKLSEIRAVIEQAKERHPLSLQGCATVVDGQKCRMYLKNFGEFFTDQVKSAETVIFSRTQNMKQDKLDQAIELIKAENPEARIITTPWDQLTGKQILETIETPAALIDIFEIFPEAGHHHDHEHEHDEHCDCHEHEHHHHEHDHGHSCSCGHHHHHHHDADEVFDNFGVETAHKFTEEQLRAALEKLSDADTYGFVLRAKGILPTEDGRWIHFDFVPEEYEIRYGSADYTGRLCVIGANIKMAEIRALLGI